MSDLGNSRSDDLPNRPPEVVDVPPSGYLVREAHQKLGTMNELMGRGSRLSRLSLVSTREDVLPKPHGAVSDASSSCTSAIRAWNSFATVTAADGYIGLMDKIRSLLRRNTATDACIPGRKWRASVGADHSDREYLPRSRQLPNRLKPKRCSKHICHIKGQSENTLHGWGSSWAGPEGYRRRRRFFAHNAQLRHALAN
jgi:hypothetical protein